MRRATLSGRASAPSGRKTNTEQDVTIASPLLLESAGLTSTAPTAPKHRVLAIDALRGAALLGVLVVNAETEFRVSIFQQFAPSFADVSGLNGFVEAAVRIGIESKAFSIFSFLFGVGLAIQFERCSTR